MVVVDWVVADTVATDSVVVVVIVMGRVTVAVVHIVEMVAVWDGFMAALGAVAVRVIGALGVPSRLAFVVVPLVFAVQVTVVHVVEMVAVPNGAVPTVRAVRMVVTRVLLMRCGHGAPSFLR